LPAFPAAAGHGSVSVRLEAAPVASSRTVAADFRTQADRVEVELTDGDGVVATATVDDLSDGTTDNTIMTESVDFDDVAAGAGSVAVRAYRGGTLIGSGGAAFALVANGSAAVAVTLGFTAGAGTGAFALAVSWPSAVGTYAEASLDGGAAFADPAASGDAVNRYASFAASGLAAGPHELAITFYADAGKTTVVGYAREAVNIWSGIASDSWVDASGSLRTRRDFGTDELFDSTIALADLEILGPATPFAFDPGTPSQDAGLVRAAAIGFVAREGAPGQSLAYRWNGISGSCSSGASYTLDLSAALPTGVNTLEIIVTAPNKNDARSYTVTCRQAYAVAFDLNDGLPASGDFEPTQYVGKGDPAVRPANPTRATGFTFAGWYAAADFSDDAWNFADPVTGPMTLYAKWTGSAGIGAVVPVPTYAGALFANAVVATAQGFPVSLSIADAALAAVASGWTWRLDGADLGVGTPTLAFDAMATAGLLGDYLVDAEVTVGGVGYSGSVLLSIRPPLAYTGALAVGDLDVIKAGLHDPGDPVYLDLIGASLPALNSYEFDACDRLAGLKLPPGIGGLPAGFLRACAALSFVSLPPGTASLGPNCFAQCGSLVSIELPLGLSVLGESCFAACSALTAIVLPSGIATVPGFCFQGCQSLESVTLPPGITEIEDFAFQGTAKLASIVIPNSVTTIGAQCFIASGLESVVVPESVINLGSGCFQSCPNLASADLPSGLRNIPSGCFFGSGSLTDIYVRSVELDFVMSTAVTGCSSLQRVHCRPGMGANFAAWAIEHPGLTVIEDIL
jgi:uncharacterized repeat protein (TIGR02543 family)